MTTKNLYQKIAAITEEVGVVEKTGRNSQQGYMFIEQAMVVATLRPLLAKYNVVVFPETVEHSFERFTNAKGTSTVHVVVKSRYHVVNGDDPKESMVAEWSGEALDTSDKATNKAMTASEKTFLMKLFKISDKEDADAETIEAPSASQKAEEPTSKQLLTIKQLFSQLGVEKEKRDPIIEQVKTKGQASDLIGQLMEKIEARKEPKVEPAED